MTEHKTDMNITKYKIWIDETQSRYENYWKTEQNFYRGIQNWHEHDWKTEQHFYDRTLSRTQLYFGASNSKHTRMFASCFDKVKWFYDRYKGFINKLYTCLSLLENFMRISVSCLIRLRDFSQEVIFYTRFSKFLLVCYILSFKFSSFFFFVFISLVCNIFTLFSLVCVFFYTGL